MKKIALFLLVLSFMGCDSGVLWEDSDFAVYWIDNPDNIELGKKLGGGAYIGQHQPPFSIGSNERYLVVKSNHGYSYCDKRVRDPKTSSGIKRYGPLTEEEFNERKDSLDLPDIELHF